MKNPKNMIKNFIVCLSLIQFAQTASARHFYLNNLEFVDKQVQINKNAIKKSLSKVSPDKVEKIAAYLVSIGLTPDKPNFKFQVDRILNSSTQFIFCEDIEDWSCLEAKPEIKQRTDMRQDVSDDLGRPIYAGDTLEMEYYFTQGWYNNFGKSSKEYVIPDVTVAEILASKIQSEGEKNIWMAIYGIDDISHTMSSVFNAIKKKFEAGINIFAVLDVSDVPKPNKEIRDYTIVKRADGRYDIAANKLQLDFSYVLNPESKNSAYLPPDWAEKYLQDVAELAKSMNQTQLRNFLLKEYFDKSMFAKQSNFDKQVKDLNWIALNRSLDDYRENLARVTFQYANTLQLLRLLNSGVKTNAESKAHLEHPFSGIMHNKYLVFEKNDGSKSVWTGTTNVTETCMGSEANSNLAVLVKNTVIANTFITEFNEMFSGKSDSSSKPLTLLTGAFHEKKSTNTPRYFTFGDKTEVRVHFSPTDDGEHRALIPLVHSARAGDLLRISMFGAGGFEMVRAMQSAVARGVNIKIILDRVTGSGIQSWWQDKNANVLQANPYSANPLGSLEIRKNKWNGLNHHKTASLSRRMADGSYRTEVIVIGSQNWSQTGNDLNDENMLTIRNKSKSLPVMDAFNKEFDEKMWPLTVDVREKLGDDDAGSDEE